MISREQKRRSIYRQGGVELFANAHGGEYLIMWRERGWVRNRIAGKDETDARRQVDEIHASLAAQGTEARRAETENTGSVHDGPVRDSECAQTIPSKQDRDYHGK